jgi:hypothetical protein
MGSKCLIAPKVCTYLCKFKLECIFQVVPEMQAIFHSEYLTCTFSNKLVIIAYIIICSLQYVLLEIYKLSKRFHPFQLILGEINFHIFTPTCS